MYEMGKKVNSFGEKVQVELQSRYADKYTSYDEDLNIFFVQQKDLDEESAGTYRIDVIVSYFDQNKEKVQM